MSEQIKHPHAWAWLLGTTRLKAFAHHDKRVIASEEYGGGHAIRVRIVPEGAYRAMRKAYLASR